MSATSNLTEETVEHLQQLIQVNIDSREGFEEAAEAIDDPKVQKLFRRLESERAANVEELKQIVEFSGVEAEDDGSIMAAVHRCWLEARAALNGGDAHVVLCEAEKGEDKIKEQYEECLKDNPGSAVSDVLHAQYAKVKAGHDEVRDLRDAYAEK